MAKPLVRINGIAVDRDQLIVVRGLAGRAVIKGRKDDEECFQVLYHADSMESAKQLVAQIRSADSADLAIDANDRLLSVAGKGGGR